MSLWGNFVGYQLVWFAAVIGAGRGLWWPGVLCGALFIGWQFTISSERRLDARLMLVALLCGLLLDGGLSKSGLAKYAADSVAMPIGGAPLWIIAMWLSFALTLRHSMRFLLGRWILALIFGALGGPLAYLGASRGWQAIAFAEPRWMPMIALALGWAIAITLLTSIATRHSKSTSLHGATS